MGLTYLAGTGVTSGASLCAVHTVSRLARTFLGRTDTAVQRTNYRVRVQSMLAFQVNYEVAMHDVPQTCSKLE